MYQKVLSYIKNNNLINTKDRVLIALSGGPDSICLLNILVNLRDELKIDIAAAHLNHLLRGEDAIKDEEYVIKICDDIGIKCFVKRVDINGYAKEYKLSSEMAGRNARYDFFNDILRNEGFNKIATAHNANDQAETILFRLMRGSGLEGLGGIKASRDGTIIRPILCMTRKEVEEYIQVNGLNPRIDKTNFEKIYNRNKIRLDMLPYIRENFNEDIIQTLNRTAVLLQKDNEFLENLSLSLYNNYCIESDNYFIIKKEIFLEAEPIVSRLLRNIIVRYSKSNYDFEMKHIYEIFSLSKKDSGKVIHLPNGIYAENIYGDIYIKRKIQRGMNDNKKQEIILNKDSININKIEFYDFHISFEIIENKGVNFIELKQDKLTKYFDFDKLEKTIVVRNRKDGDRITMFGMNGSKKIKDIFIDMKMPKDQRDKIPIVCFDNKIAWLVGVRTAAEYKISDTSKKILKVAIKRKEY